jgi:hypothetical protein
VTEPHTSADSDAVRGGSADGHGDADPNDGRDETRNERLDRNWGEIVQELRVTQTGTQILTGFLLTLAFQQRFDKLTGSQTVIYLVLVVLAAITTALGLTPVAMHRALFRKRAMANLVAVGDRILRITLAGVCLIITGTTLFIFDVVLNVAAGLIGGAFALVVTLGLWILLPNIMKSRIHD